MSIWKSLNSRRKQFRWRLTFSYTAVTVGALLVVELILYIVGAGTISYLIDSGYIPGELIESVSTTYAPRLQHYLEESPEDLDEIGIFLESIRPPQYTVGYSFDESDGLLVIRSDGLLLGMSPAGYIENAPVGQVLDFDAMLGLEVPLMAALAGEENSDNLFSPVNSENIVVMTVPVWDDSHQHVLGVIVMSAEAPTLASYLGDLLPILGISFLIFTIIGGLIGTAFGFLAGGTLTSRLEQLAEASLSWSQGDFTVSIDDPSEDEVGQLANRLNQMARELENLLDTRSELVLVEERNRLARDLHDSVKQKAFAASAQISTVRRLMGKDPDKAQTHVEQAERLIDNLREELTGLIKELLPPPLEDKGLVSALREFTEDWSQQNEIELDLRIKNERSFPVSFEQVIFKIVQEALSNVARHSQATHVLVRLVFSGQDLKCTIKDDGKGFNLHENHSGFGLRSLQERASGLGSELNIKSALGEGTEVSFTVLSRVQIRSRKSSDE